MKQKLLLLLTALMLLVTGNAWGETIGATDKGWGESGAYKRYLLSANKTLTLTFTLTNYSGEWAGYVVNLTKTDVPAFGGDNGYVWFRGVDFGWFKSNWGVGAVVSNTNNKGSLSQTDWQAFVKDATTVMVIQRLGTQVFIKTTVTKDATSYSHYFVSEIGTTKDIYAFLCADAAVIDIASDATTETGAVDPTTATIGTVDNTGDFGASPVTTLAPESVLNFHFTNLSAAAEGWKNYGIELSYGGKFANIVVGGGRWGELLVDNKESEPVTTPKINKEENFNEFGGEFSSKMNGADVSLTIARSGRVVTITAVNTPADKSTPYTLKYTLEPNATAFPNFATEDLTVNLSTDHSHITYNFPISEVNAEVSKYGWATFSSNYKLDFSGVSGLEAYAVTGHVENAITKSDALGVVAANAGVLLKGTEGTTSTFYNVPVSTGEAYDGTNLMVAGTGASVGYVAEKTRYVLGVNGSTNKAEFQKLVDGGSSATVPTGKAYLQFDEVISDARALIFDPDEVTSINVVEVTEPEAGALKDGKFLENGKIVIVKNGVKYSTNGQILK